jgi:hypothetical protein
MMTPEQLAALHDGDKVILAQDGYAPWRRVETVRLTPTQIIVGTPPRETRFDRTTGRLKGERGYWRTELRPYSPDADLRLKTVRAIEEVTEALKTMTLDTVEALEQGPCVDLYRQLTQLRRALAACGQGPLEQGMRR